ncbi:unnamed protein product [Heligmosomoides polygyrus]|uniref:Pyrin domain-containing protein n=1 Tax=Heligmosomoides polygyrus TaxID=6339 RepID=A0A183GUP5_HELPZ|nr:unnamed protein product [Heligmosomoides polygyrus]
MHPKPSPAAPAQEPAHQLTSAPPQGRSSRTDQRAERTNPQERPEREQDQSQSRDMGTVEELTASQFRTVFNYIVSNNVLRDLLKHLELPPRKTTQVRKFEVLETESLQYVSVVTAHATRMIKVLQAYQMLQAFHYRVTPHSEEDTDYTYLMRANTPETLDSCSY